MFQRDFDNTGNIKEFAVWAADFMDNLPVGMYRVTLEGELVFCNWSFAQQLGYNAPAKLQDFKVVELFPHKSERGKFVRQVIDHGSVRRYPMQLRRKSGDLFTCSTTARAVVNDDGQVTYIDGVMHESMSQDGSSWSRASFSGEQDSLDVYLRVDFNGLILDMSEGAAEVFGRPSGNRSETLSLYSFIDSKSRDKLAKMLNSVREQELFVDVMTLTDSRGHTRQMECQATVVSFHGDDDRIALVCRDVSNSVESMRQSQIEERLQGVVEMAGGIAHNMNQPLTVMNNLLHDLESNLSEKDRNVHDKLSRIQYQLDKLNTIAKKVRSVKQYKSVHYLLGEKIVDIDQLS